MLKLARELVRQTQLRFLKRIAIRRLRGRAPPGGQQLPGQPRGHHDNGGAGEGVGSREGAKAIRQRPLER
jgi:hypothetical protein